jgi:hypothetical protein
MEGLCPDFPLLLEAVNNIFVAPTNFVRKALRLDESPPNFEVIVNSPLLCSISALASIEGPAKPLVQPFASSYHKEAGRPRRVSDVQGRQYRVRSCGAPCPWWHGTEFWKERGDEKGLIFWGWQYGVCEGSYGSGAWRIDEWASVSGRLWTNTAHLVTEEAARDVDFLAANDDNLLAIQNLLGYNGGQPTEEVTLAVNDDWGWINGGHGESEEGKRHNV